MNQELKSKFLKTYSNLPLSIRGEIISIVDGHPVTWNVAYIEIKGETEKGEKILKNLMLLGLL